MLPASLASSATSDASVACEGGELPLFTVGHPPSLPPRQTPPPWPPLAPVQVMAGDGVANLGGGEAGLGVLVGGAVGAVAGVGLLLSLLYAHLRIRSRKQRMRHSVATQSGRGPVESQTTDSRQPGVGPKATVSNCVGSDGVGSDGVSPKAASGQMRSRAQLLASDKEEVVSDEEPDLEREGSCCGGGCPDSQRRKSLKGAVSGAMAANCLCRAGAGRGLFSAPQVKLDDSERIRDAEMPPPEVLPPPGSTRGLPSHTTEALRHELRKVNSHKERHSTGERRAGVMDRSGTRRRKLDEAFTHGRKSCRASTKVRAPPRNQPTEREPGWRESPGRWRETRGEHSKEPQDYQQHQEAVAAELVSQRI